MRWSPLEWQWWSRLGEWLAFVPPVHVNLGQKILQNKQNTYIQHTIFNLSYFTVYLFSLTGSQHIIYSDTNLFELISDTWWLMLLLHNLIYLFIYFFLQWLIHLPFVFQPHVHGDAGCAEDECQYCYKCYAGKISRWSQDQEGVPLPYNEEVKFVVTSVDSSTN